MAAAPVAAGAGAGVAGGWAAGGFAGGWLGGGWVGGGVCANADPAASTRLTAPTTVIVFNALMNDFPFELTTSLHGQVTAGTSACVSVASVALPSAKLAS